MPIHTPPDPVAQRVAIIQQLARPSAKPEAGDAPLPALENDPSEAPPSAGAVPASEKRGVSKWAKLLFAAGLGADTATTLNALANGGHEANPMVNFAGDKAAVPIMLGGEAATMLLAKKLLGDRHPKIMNALVSGSGIAHGAAAVHNLMLPKSAPAKSQDIIVYDTGNGGIIPPK